MQEGENRLDLFGKIGAFVCVCVCVCERERERERKKEIQHGGGENNSLLSYLVWVPDFEGLFR